MKQLSLMKFMRYVSQNMNLLPKLIRCYSFDNDGQKAIVRYCTYEKRRRENFETTTKSIIDKINTKEKSLA